MYIKKILNHNNSGGKAIINARVNDDGDIVTDGEQVMIGGNERYVTMCRKCYRELINKSN